MRERWYVLSVSGGKDSTATGLHLIERGIEFEAIHMDTGWEHPATEAYVRETLPRVLGREVRILSAPLDLAPEVLPIAEDLEARFLGGKPSAFIRRSLHKAMFPSRQRRYCTQELKVYPSRAYFRTLSSDVVEPVNVQGIRWEESARRAKMVDWEEFDGDCAYWRPILDWTERDVIDIHHRHGVAPNPLYLRGARRVGCWPCIMSAKAEIRLLAEIDPARVNLVDALEQAVAALAVTGQPRTLFQNPRPTRTIGEDGTVHRSGECVPFREVVAWSLTARGGTEPDPFAPDPADEGCARWGLCEPVPFGRDGQGRLFVGGDDAV